MHSYTLYNETTICHKLSITSLVPLFVQFEAIPLEMTKVLVIPTPNAFATRIDFERPLDLLLLTLFLVKHTNALDRAVIRINSPKLPARAGLTAWGAV
jgi:hypothetical protein